jgi:hypothetical protein
LGYYRSQIIEARVQESEENLRFALEAANTIAFTWDVASGEVRRSSNAETQMGLGQIAPVVLLSKKRMRCIQKTAKGFWQIWMPHSGHGSLRVGIPQSATRRLSDLASRQRADGF